nr:PREDICTED: TMV resistance protein N-like [Daucus carota subsp. sativus]
MWQLNKASRVFEELKTLNMSYSHLSSTPDFTKFPSLETLNLEGCESLEEIDMSIGSLSRLVSLTLRGCVKLKRLPDTICNLRALKILTIDSCISLEALPIKLGNIESLTKLNASGLNVLKLPNSIRRLSKLVELNLKGNKYLENLPHTICNLRALQVLDIGGCSNLDTLPTAIGSIKSLRELNAEKLAVSNLLDSIGY